MRHDFLNSHVRFVLSLLAQLILVNGLFGSLTKHCLRLGVLLKLENELVDLLSDIFNVAICRIGLHL